MYLTVFLDFAFCFSLFGSCLLVLVIVMFVPFCIRLILDFAYACLLTTKLIAFKLVNPHFLIVSISVWTVLSHYNLAEE